MTAPRHRRSSGRTLFGTLFWVALIFCAARLLLLACRGSLERPARPPGGSVAVPQASASSATPARGSEASIARSIHVALGVPHAELTADEFFLDEGAYVLSYSPQKRVPNWAAWRLDQSYFGNVRRRDDFRPDLSLPAHFYRVHESDYLHSGYDRGHLCPSADREDSIEDNSRTFLFTNMQPQLHELNAGPWERLELYARKRAQRGQVLYQLAGGVFSAPPPTIGNGVAVPSANYKIIVFLREGERAADLDLQSEVLAVMMPNQHGVGEHDWSEYLTSVDAIERATGYDFLSAVPEPVQRVLEARTAHL